MNSKMKILLTLILAATLALGVVNSVSAVDLGVNSDLNAVDSISYNAYSNEIKNVANEINTDDGYSPEGVSEEKLIQESGNSSNGNAMDPVLNSENERTHDLQFINEDIEDMENTNTSDISLINSINLVNSTVDNGAINSLENMMLTPTISNNAVDNGENYLNENSMLTPIIGNDYAVIGINNSNKEISGLEINAISIDENNNQIGTYIDANYDSETKVAINNITYGDAITGIVEVTGNNKNLNGTVEIIINGESENITVIDGKGTININMDLAVGSYNVTAKYLGDIDYKESNDTTQFTVNPIKVNMNVICENITYGEEETINIILTEDITGNVTITLSNGQKYNVPITSGKGTLKITNLGAGTYTIDAMYNSTDSKYSNARKNTSFIISPAETEIRIILNNMEYTKNLTGQIGLFRNDEPLKGTVWITLRIDNIDSSNIQIKVTDGIAYINTRVYYQDPALLNASIPGEYHYLPVGIHTATVEIDGDGQNYTISQAEKTFYVTKATPKMNITVEGEYIIIVNLPIGIIEPIKVYVNGESYLVNVTKGVAILQLDTLQPGTYYVEAVFDGNNNYWNASANTTFTVPNNDYNGQSSDALEGNLLLDLTSDETGNPIALLILALAIVLPVRKVFKK